MAPEPFPERTDAGSSLLCGVLVRPLRTVGEFSGEFSVQGDGIRDPAGPM
ncbi:hypothetical protein [Streptomyces cavernicola]|uniref:AraC family transcriptional regulator n=1 Tax=Streptomyces cavernicola TaxID=3043613 RepID=A0ABT6S6W6_9ACTN|nr:hypothetical protein [Streptomyces sp. B-S-A6]MDI3403846.1 hypothetical protein [Streptomyces sp. B-S-A6]